MVIEEDEEFWKVFLPCFVSMCCFLWGTFSEGVTSFDVERRLSFWCVCVRQLCRMSVFLLAYPGPHLIQLNFLFPLFTTLCFSLGISERELPLCTTMYCGLAQLTYTSWFQQKRNKSSNMKKSESYLNFKKNSSETFCLFSSYIHCFFAGNCTSAQMMDISSSSNIDTSSSLSLLSAQLIVFMLLH